jgi:DNA helicase II / ATP-dependent DNA helicase PcrA
MLLNKEQKTASEHVDGPCLVTAVPGSGKTRTLAARVINLVQSGVNIKHILCLTFTNKAADEMKHRIAKQIGQQSDGIWISTFHRLCVAILRKYHDKCGISSSFTVYDDGDQKELMSKIARMNEYDCSKYEIYDMIKAANDFREDTEDFHQALSSLKPIQVNIIDEYLKTIDEFDAVDFSGLLYKTYLLLIKHNDVVDKLSNKFKYVLVDEGQDTNTIQYEIIKRIARHGNIFVVADQNQSIFAFRGAKPENLDRLKKDFENVKCYTLPRNYRSTSEILSAAQRLIRNNPNAKDVSLVSDRGSGHGIRIATLSHPEAESDYLVSRIQQLRHEYNLEWKDFAVLYRTNQQSKAPEISLRQADIPYHIFGGFSFFDRAEIKTTIAYLSLLVNPRDTMSFARAISNPKRKIGDTTIGRIERIAQQKQIPILEACKTIDQTSVSISAIGREKLRQFVEVIEQHHKMLDDRDGIGKVAAGLLHESGYYRHMEQASETDPDFQKRVENIDEMISNIYDFGSKNPDGDLSDYLQKAQLMSPDDQPIDNAVNLLTMHSAKGLEFPVVFIIGAEKGIVPHVMAEKEGREDEERRLFYVAMTRSEDHLFITSCESRLKFNRRLRRNDLLPCYPSPFLFEIGAKEVSHV